MLTWFWIGTGMGVVFIGGLIGFLHWHSRRRARAPGVRAWVNGEQVPSEALELDLGTGTVSFRPGFEPRKGDQVSIEYTIPKHRRSRPPRRRQR